MVTKMMTLRINAIITKTVSAIFVPCLDEKTSKIAVIEKAAASILIKVAKIV